MNKKTAILLTFTLLLLLSSVASAEVEIKGYVNDYANIISDSDESLLNLMLQDLHQKNIAEYSIVTIDSLEGQDIESYALNLAQGVLGDKEKNNGLLLLVAVQDRKYRFEVGRGLEPILPDGKIGRVGRDYLVPNFRAEDYGTGIIEASRSIDSILRNDIDSDYYVSESSDVDLSIIDTIYIIVFLLFFILFPILAFFLKRRKFKNKYFDAAAGLIILMGNRGGRGSGGFDGGGFGGFSGGSFGGGGSSGGW